MGKEVENLIMENNELLATKNALNIVKDDLIVKVDELTGELEILREELNAVIQSRNKLKVKVGELEDDLRKAKEQMKQQNSEHEENDDVPMAQRKRFTRVEMARVLMERNQYKERFMELQDAVRWTEMMRATKVDQLDKKSKQSVWKFFSNLFSSNDRPQGDRPPSFRNSASSGEGRSQFQAIGAVNPGSGSQSLVLASKDFNEGHSSNDGTSERAQARRREQYRQVRAHVQKEDGRLQAYGWSLPGASGKPQADGRGGKGQQGVPVPVPVYCRPLAEASPHMKVWCASGVNLNGGYTKDGGCVVGASIFYSRQVTATITDITTPTNENPPSELESLDKQMKLAMDQVDQDQQLSSYVWICTSTHSASTVTVIDAKNPAEVLDSFPICQTHLLCICTVIGALEMDYHMLENSEVTKAGEMLEKPGDPGDPDELGKVEFTRVPSQSNNDTDVVEDGNGDIIEKASEASPDVEEDTQLENPTSVGPTMWLGAQNGMIYVHSSATRWRVCLHAVQLPDAVLSIVHVAGRVVVALANGQVAVFRRQTNGEWDVNSYHLVTLGSPKQSVRCLTIVGDKVWAAHRNRIHVIDPITLNIVHTLEAHPRKESQIRQMAATGLGVWVSIRLDSTLRLYHSQTYEHLQDVDIEPYVSKMLGTGKLGFSFVRITSLHVSCGRLWIGTGNGVIISVPLIGDGSCKSINYANSIKDS